MIVREAIETLRSWAPEESAQQWDNVGLQIGSPQEPLKGVLVALDAAPAVADEAVSLGANLIVTHHPLIFEPLKSIRTDRYPDSVVASLIRSGISLYAMHTNLDAAVGGVNDILAEIIGIVDAKTFDDEGEGKLALVGDVKEARTFSDFLSGLKNNLGVTAITYNGRLDSQVRRVAVCAGAGGGFLEGAVERGADVLVTADVKHSHWLQAEGRINLVDAGHFETESAVLDSIVRRLNSEPALEGINVTRSKAELNPVTLFSIEPYKQRNETAAEDVKKL